MKKVGILTFHRSYNCGSMMQAYALQEVLKKLKLDPEIIDFSTFEQQKVYRTWFPINSLRNIVKNILIAPHKSIIDMNNGKYQDFLNTCFALSSEKFFNMAELRDEKYDAIIAGSDQIWNITIDDSDDAYFLPWVKNAKKIAYAPSFGARNIKKYTPDWFQYASYIDSFEHVSIRENNGKKWIKDLIHKDVPVVLDPTLLLCAADYEKIVETRIKTPEKYIFYYAPHYDNDINILVKKISNKLRIPVIAFNAKGYYVKQLHRLGFSLPEFENPAVYLRLIKDAELVITTSFHGTAFSSIFKKRFWTVKNGEMLGDDDRVKTLTDMLDLSDRVIPIYYEENFDYLKIKDYDIYSKKLEIKKEEALRYLQNALTL
ncbi:polysaccharide pyruvyl transferase family protein [Eisenbergiella tayi]|uniref:polysaccharide pyruvyl transferase family protein n=1 Tax=Eisenbergiella tayi TaxID=1432052 RepID=UPI000848F8CC|nr:polysaccharide pyruvyl transferase family protein [Eisenbergiella tayi]ODR35234.1 hypothetical protein BEI60_19430 [Eisenbergiella tayi]